MAKLFIVRHGQAAFGQANYDQLSNVGWQQARWLGEYFAERELTFHRVVAGDLQRQQDTAKGVLEGMADTNSPIVTHAGLNEYDGEMMYQAFTGQSNQHLHQKRDFKDYWRTFRSAYEAWIDDELTDITETWGDFGSRVEEAIAHACEGAGREDAVLVVTSGGVIGSALTALVEGPQRGAINFNFQFRNTGFCEVIMGRSARRLLSFNNVPHLDRAGRRHALTHV
ncbi:histidine phosphatase family protein [Marinobacter adhaerens]|uniref:Histidine phosphatase family protein n=1 Tax=Marinobacter adhaerens TaxID=1033846 RepID=A0A851HS75_9GAMM|nr:histidine phosphatase family protein [Marinobacter adhaerens]NWN91817.1 histidine phosphatase family protein [Marinobacter adhaerens]